MAHAQTPGFTTDSRAFVTIFSMNPYPTPARLAGWLFVLTVAAAPAFAQAPLPAAAPASAAAPAAPEGAPIDVWEFAVEGNSVLDVITIEQAVTPFLGPQRRLADLDAARAALERAYQTRGFLTVFVDLPEQRVDDGVVILKVLEGRIARTSVTGSRYYSQGYIRDKVPAFTEGTVPNFNAAQAELAVVNRTEQRRVQPVLKPGRDPGTVEVEMKVADQLPVSGTVELNNQHAPDTDPWRLLATLRYDNLFQRDHAITLTGSVAPREPSQARALIVNYSVPLDNGNSIIAYAVNSTSAVQTLGGTSVLGDGTTLGLRYAIPFEGGGGLHSLTLGADYKDLNERITFGADSFATPLRYLPFQASYTGNWAEKDSQTSLTATFVAASRSIFQRDVTCPGSSVPVDQFACKRFGGDGSFSTLRLGARHTMALGPASLALRANAQLATQPLPSSEQFALGGVETIRGYLDGEVVGDRGFIGSVELRSPNWARATSSLFERAVPLELGEVTLFAFTDLGRAYLIDPLPGQAARVPMLSSGAGLRVSGRPGWSLGLDWAVAHKTTVATTRGDSLIHVRLGWKY